MWSAITSDVRQLWEGFQEVVEHTFEDNDGYEEEEQHSPPMTNAPAMRNKKDPNDATRKASHREGEMGSPAAVGGEKRHAVVPPETKGSGDTDASVPWFLTGKPWIVSKMSVDAWNSSAKRAVQHQQETWKKEGEEGSSRIIAGDEGRTAIHLQVQRLTQTLHQNRLRAQRKKRLWTQLQRYDNETEKETPREPSEEREGKEKRRSGSLKRAQESVDPTPTAKKPFSSTAMHHEVQEEKDQDDNEKEEGRQAKDMWKKMMEEEVYELQKDMQTFLQPFTKEERQRLQNELFVDGSPREKEDRNAGQRLHGGDSNSLEETDEVVPNMEEAPSCTRRNNWLYAYGAGYTRSGYHWRQLHDAVEGQGHADPNALLNEEAILNPTTTTTTNTTATEDAGELENTSAPSGGGSPSVSSSVGFPFFPEDLCFRFLNSQSWSPSFLTQLFSKSHTCRRGVLRESPLLQQQWRKRKDDLTSSVPEEPSSTSTTFRASSDREDSRSVRHVQDGDRDVFFARYFLRLFLLRVRQRDRLLNEFTSLKQESTSFRQMVEEAYREYEAKKSAAATKLLQENQPEGKDTEVDHASHSMSSRPSSPVESPAKAHQRDWNGDEKNRIVSDNREEKGEGKEVQEEEEEDMTDLEYMLNSLWSALSSSSSRAIMTILDNEELEKGKEEVDREEVRRRLFKELLTEEEDHAEVENEVEEELQTRNDQEGFLSRFLGQWLFENPNEEEEEEKEVNERPDARVQQGTEKTRMEEEAAEETQWTGISSSSSPAEDPLLRLHEVEHRLTETASDAVQGLFEGFHQVVDTILPGVLFHDDRNSISENEETTDEETNKENISPEKKEMRKKKSTDMEDAEEVNAS